MCQTELSRSDSAKRNKQAIEAKPRRITGEGKQAIEAVIKQEETG